MAQALTYLQLCRETVQRCKISGTMSSVVGQTGEFADVALYVTEAWDDIQAARDDWQWMRGAFSFDTQNGKELYSPLEILQNTTGEFGKWEENTFRCEIKSLGAQSRQFIDHLPFEVFRDQYQYQPRQPGRPVSFTEDPGTRGIFLGEIPDAEIYTITGRYVKTPTTLAANEDVPDFPVRFHRLLVYKAMLKYGITEAAAELVAMANAGIAEHEGRLRRTQGARVSVEGPLA